MKFNDQFKKLDDVGSVGRGKSKHRPRNDMSLFGGNYPFIQTGDVRKAEYYLTEYSQTYNEKGLAQSKLWDEGTLCITIAANIAETAVLGVKACFPDSIIGFVPDKEKSDVRFIKYCLETYKLQMQSISKGATQDNLSLEKLRSINFSIPELPVQKRIADVLYSYDNLIENNTNRIFILEQMAEQLYKEWFVRMRFPNYEKTKFVKGFPEDWSIESVGSLVNRKKFGNTYKQNEVAESGKVIVYDQSIKPYLGFHNNNADHLASVLNPYILFGDHSCKMLLVTTPFSLGENVIPILPKNGVKTYFLYQMINELVETTEYKRHWKELIARKVLVPTEDLQTEFSLIVKPFFEIRAQLERANENLRKTRDLLLPRLISGKLQIQIEKQKSVSLEKAVTPFYQKQILAHIIKKQEEYNVPQGEMVLAKNAYLLQALFGVNTGFNWKNWHYGTYDGKIRQLINGRDKFFAKEEVGNSGYKVLILGDNKEKILNHKYHHSILDEVDNGMDELLEIYSHYPSGKERSHKIELLNTTVKSIVDTQSLDEKIILQAFKEWKTPKADFPTKADKFNEIEIENCIHFIISKQWDKKLIAS